MRVFVKRSVLGENRLRGSHTLLEGSKEFLTVGLLENIFNDIRKIQFKNLQTILLKNREYSGNRCSKRLLHLRA